MEVIEKYKRGILRALPDSTFINSLLSIEGDVNFQRLSEFLDKYKICIIYEGNEEYGYLKRIKN